ncbi:error-prone DNA polymerase [Segnochrobactrum spirostomi]|uniref:Error-prone DNA polymerase n=1 Tax=Segnochrobactrum spirostomi TaxID=2608987 RepID=A0A6A7XZH2_9HYPH|nr:error-prone DNA polymerase [Segnochrobactrum spirostomi]MQT11698.1 DNA polymerase III subunit alpha [Segnochrobactrum spirostomi]
MSDPARLSLRPPQPAYAELAAATNFSFLRGASHPGEMVEQAAALGIAALGVADRNSFAGIVRAFAAARAVRRRPAAEGGVPDFRLVVGVRLLTADTFEALAYPTDRAAYGRLCRLLTLGNRRAAKGECHFSFAELEAAAEGSILIVLPPPAVPGRTRRAGSDFAARLRRLAEARPGAVFLGAVHRHAGDEPRRLGRLDALGRALGAPMVAIGDVLYHEPERAPLADVLTAIREGCPIAAAGFRLAANAERHLKGPAEMARLFAAFPEAVARTLDIAAACRFRLDELTYEYPDEPVPPGTTPQAHLEHLTWTGAARRYPGGVPASVREKVVEELKLIEALGFARYFLTVHDVVWFARGKGILCQGRGSAANSAVCFCLGITEIDPNESSVLFARFISQARGEPPDIDVDFEHERREEVIQYIYRRYGRDRAAICSTVVHYRPRRAIREVGKAMGLTPDVTAALAKTVWGSHGGEISAAQVREAGLDPGNPALAHVLALTNTLIGFPRHLSQHVGGFVLTRERLDETVPIGNAAMEDRTFIEWDKDDIDVLGLMKVDVLALGMLTCLHRAFDLMKTHIKTETGAPLDLTIATVQQDDTATYDMLCQADSVGVFQVESRAQMSMLPRLKPRRFYDLVIEVAIVRPGPIQGGMVHPYLRRREAPEKAFYPSPAPDKGPPDELEAVLSRTLGVPLFQEQAMQIAMVAAEFTADEADGLRRAMATFRNHGTVHTFADKFIGRMVARGYERDFAERCFEQIKGFGEYGFPESHAASFAKLVYVSAWIKCHHPDVFCAAILNSQPMGFYHPAQLVRDARRHGVEVRPVDINDSLWETGLEATSGSHHAVRLGFNQVEGLREADMERLVAARGNGYASLERLASVVPRAAVERLAEADAFGSLGLDRRAALWAVRRLPAIAEPAAWLAPLEEGTAAADRAPPVPRQLSLLADPMGDGLFPEPDVHLPEMPVHTHVVEDYRTTGLSLKAHPVSFFRDRLTRLGAVPNADLRGSTLGSNAWISVAGLVITRQQPGTSKGVVFMTLEDETDIANIVVWPKIFARERRCVMTSRFVLVRGRLQKVGLVIHVVAARFLDLSDDLRRLDEEDLSRPSEAAAMLPVHSRDFH